MRFKRGWATEQRTAYLCGRVLDHAGVRPPARRTRRRPGLRMVSGLPRACARRRHRVTEPRSSEGRGVRGAAARRPAQHRRPRQAVERVEGMLDRRWLTNDGPLVHEFERRSPSWLGVSPLRRHVQRHRRRSRSPSGPPGSPARSSFPRSPSSPPPTLSSGRGSRRSSATSTRARTISTPTDVEALITPRTTGIIGVHLWGRPCAGRGADRDRRRPRARAAVRRRPRLRLLPSRADDRRLRATPRCSASTRRSSSTPSRAGGRHQRRRAGREHAADAELRVRRLRRGHLRGHQREDERGRPRRWVSRTSSPSTTSCAANRRNHQPIGTGSGTSPGCGFDYDEGEHKQLPVRGRRGRRVGASPETSFCECSGPRTSSPAATSGRVATAWSPTARLPRRRDDLPQTERLAAAC